jgi:hypothetical protein
MALTSTCTARCVLCIPRPCSTSKCCLHTSSFPHRWDSISGSFVRAWLLQAIDTRWCRCPLVARSLCSTGAAGRRCPGPIAYAEGPPKTFRRTPPYISRLFCFLSFFWRFSVRGVQKYHTDIFVKSQCRKVFSKQIDKISMSVFLDFFCSSRFRVFLCNGSSKTLQKRFAKKARRKAFTKNSVSQRHHMKGSSQGTSSQRKIPQPAAGAHMRWHVHSRRKGRL